MVPSPALLLRHLTTSLVSDALLLECFTRQHDETAFAALVQRHGPLVQRVCRHVLADPDVAEDAFQATFCVLARKAASVRPPERLASWLHGVAHRTALKAQTAQRKRGRGTKELDEESVDPRSDPLAEVSTRETLLLLDEEIGRLPEGNRLPIILCCLEGLSLEEAAQRLGWTRDSVKGRLERGRKRLHERLLRRGLTLGAALAAAVVVRAPVTASLVGLTVRTALAFAAGKEVSGATVAAPGKRSAGSPVGRNLGPPLDRPGFLPGRQDPGGSRHELDTTLHLWDVATGRNLSAGNSHEGAVMSASLTRGGQFLATSGEDNTVCLWDTAHGEVLRRFPGRGLLGQDNLTILDLLFQGGQVLDAFADLFLGIARPLQDLVQFLVQGVEFLAIALGHFRGPTQDLGQVVDVYVHGPGDEGRLGTDGN